MLFLLTLLTTVFSLSVDITDKSSICSASQTIAEGVLQYYKGDGVFDSPYYWWQYGEAFHSLLRYQAVCGDNQYEDLVYNGIIAQVGDDWNFQPAAQAATEGNDDQGTWGLVVVEAAEMGFKSPQQQYDVTWTQLAEKVFSTLYARWDMDTCNGGLRWQYDSSHSGYDYKATIANANLFQIAARLAKLTDNKMYAVAAEEIYNWLLGVNVIQEGEWGSAVVDGVTASENCSTPNGVEWTYNYGIMIGGGSYLYDFTKDQDWYERTEDIILGSQILYNDTILYERACELFNSCNVDQKTFKGIYIRSLAKTAVLVPDLKSKVQDLLDSTAKAAAESCSGSDNACGLSWCKNGYDGDAGLPQQLNALEAIQNMILVNGL